MDTNALATYNSSFIGFEAGLTIAVFENMFTHQYEPGRVDNGNGARIEAIGFHDFPSQNPLW